MYFDRTPSTLLKVLSAITFRAVKLRLPGPAVALTEQEIALTKAFPGKLYYNQLTTRTRGLPQG